MTLPRSTYVDDEHEGVYHCFSRCVRRAFLCGYDALTGRDFSHRKALLLERLRFLASVFAIEVCAYAILATHFHTILRTRPDIVARWSDQEVAARWLTLFPRHRRGRGAPSTPTQKEIRALAACPERIAQLRTRLSSLSWLMGRLNEFVARAANKEDNVKGRFWEGRFKCQALLDEAAIAACMVYVDLNPIRAGLADSPEDSDFTSIQERLRAWAKATSPAGSVPDLAALPTPPATSISMDADKLDNSPILPDPLPGSDASLADPSVTWLCPIQSDSRRRGILDMTPAQYFDLVDWSGRMTRPDKRGTVDPGLAPILLRIGANPRAWPDTVSRFGSKFRLAAGLASSLRHFADRLGRRWFQGIATAQAAFLSPRPHLA